MSELTNLLRRSRSATNRPAVKGQGMAASVLACLIAGCGGGSDGRAPAPVAAAPPLGPILGEPPPGPILGAPGPQVVAATCAGADLSGLKSQVFVKAGGTDGPSCGTTTTNACQTIQQGINNCAVSGCGVLVRHGLYPTTATITLRDAVSVYGSCLFDGEADHKYRTTISGPADKPAVAAESINSPTTLYGVAVLAGDAAAVGGPSIAMTAASSKGLALSHLQLVSGKGANGQPGAGAGAVGGGDPGGAFGTPGAGGQACSASYGGPLGHGGAGSENVIDVNRGSCFINCGCGRDGISANAGPGAASGAAMGGATGNNIGSAGCACDGRPSDSPGGGDGGQAGDAGVCSTQGGAAAHNSAGTFMQTAWQPVLGGGGTQGGLGAGGGGGQAGGYAVEFVFGSPAGTQYNGGPGGGGGGGGCGGLPGGGGQQGGASIVLVSSASALALDGTTVLIAGPGGAGGMGGAGGTGGSGGSGAPSSGGGTAQVCLNQTSVPGAGGSGGSGGNGGAGSGGAGGNGGPSLGVALVSAAAKPSPGGIYLGTPGAGAANGSGAKGGLSNCAAPDGQGGNAGVSAGAVNFDLPLASILFAGQQLSVNQSITSPNGSAVLIMQGDSNFCLYVSGNPVWCTNSVGDGIPAAIMQTDGNLCLYPTNGQGPICSGTAGHPDAYLIVQDEGRIQIIDGGMVLWTEP